MSFYHGQPIATNLAHNLNVQKHKLQQANLDEAINNHLWEL